MLRTLMLASLVITWLAAGPAPASAAAQEVAAEAPAAQEVAASKALTAVSVAHRVLFYLPNRAFDVLDVARLRVRVGPGFAISLRATELASFFLGAYTTVWGGLHGPRGASRLPLPAGVEANSGVEVSVADASTAPLVGPGYGFLEVGTGWQLFLLGVDLGIDPGEVLDLAAGLFLFDPVGDDF